MKKKRKKEYTLLDSVYVKIPNRTNYVFLRNVCLGGKSIKSKEMIKNSS